MVRSGAPGRCQIHLHDPPQEERRAPAAEIGFLDPALRGFADGDRAPEFRCPVERADRLGDLAERSGGSIAEACRR
jgi:hypothetical protein